MPRGHTNLKVINGLIGGLYHAPVIPAWIRSFLRNPVESFLAGSPAKIAIPGTSYSGGIEPFRNWDWNGPEMDQNESGGMQLNRFIYFTIIFFIFISIIFAKCTMCSPHHGSIAIMCININDDLISTHTNDDDNQSRLSRHRCVFFFFSFSFLILSTDNHLDRLGMHTATIKSDLDTSQWAPHRHKPCGSPSAYDKTKTNES